MARICGMRLRVVGINWRVAATEVRGDLVYLAGGHMASSLEELRALLVKAYGKHGLRPVSC